MASRKNIIKSIEIFSITSPMYLYLMKCIIDKILVATNILCSKTFGMVGRCPIIPNITIAKSIREKVSKANSDLRLGFPLIGMKTLRMSLNVALVGNCISLVIKLACMPYVMEYISISLLKE